jgi:hypothetical protein
MRGARLMSSRLGSTQEEATAGGAVTGPRMQSTSAAAEGVPTSLLVHLPDGWVMRRVPLDAGGCDPHGWRWGLGEPLWHLSDGADSLTVRAPCPALAVAIVTIESWPPCLLRRYNWEYETP